MAFDIIKNAINYNVEYKWLTLDETIEEIMRIRKEKVDEIERIKAKTTIK